MFTQRQRKILSILKQHQSNITSDEIARLVGVSSRTIRTEIKNILPNLDEKIAKINISTRKGYSIEIINQRQFSNILDEYIYKNQDNEARIKYIIQYLLNNALKNQSIKQQDLADKLFISLSTLKTHLKEVKGKLKKYNLDIINYKNQGMQIIGNEAQIRYCISEYIFRDNLQTDDFYRQLFAEYNLNNINNILIKVLTSYELVLTDISLKNLLVHVLIAMKRATKEHNVIYTLRESKEIEQHKEFLIATSIFEEIYNQLHIDVATSEIYYLAQHLIASKKYMEIANEETSHYIKNLVIEMLQRVNTIVNINFLKDDNLIKWLKIHLESVIPRIRFQMNIRNDILDVIKNEYPLAFQVAVIASKVIEEKEHIPVDENEIGYIAVHFGGALTRMNIEADKIKKSAIVVCGGIGTAVLLKAKLKEYFKDLIHIINTIPGYQLKKEDLNRVDLVFTTIPLPHLKNLSSEKLDKIIHIKNLLNNEEIQLIQQKFFKSSDISKTNIKKFFRKDYFITNKQFNTKEEILSYLTNKLENSGLIDSETTSSIFERELASPTEIGNMVALPHPMVNNTAISSISILVLNKPIIWVDHHVQVVFLISIAKDEFYLWEPIFLKLFKYLVKENGIKQIINQPNYDDFIKNFQKEFN